MAKRERSLFGLGMLVAAGWAFFWIRRLLGESEGERAEAGRAPAASPGPPETTVTGAPRQQRRSGRRPDGDQRRRRYLRPSPARGRDPHFRRPGCPHAGRGAAGSQSAALAGGSGRLGSPGQGEGGGWGVKATVRFFPAISAGWVADMTRPSTVPSGFTLQENGCARCCV